MFLKHMQFHSQHSAGILSQSHHWVPGSIRIFLPAAVCSMPGQYDTGSFDPSPVTLQLAQEPAHPVLPRQVQQRPAPKTRRERIPLSSSLTGEQQHY